MERLDTVLCWLRPSCLSSRPAGYKIPATPSASKRSSTPPKPKQPQQDSPQIRPSTKCLTSIEATTQASKPFVTISYVEPTTKANGEALTDFGKTTIFHDLGRGMKNIRIFLQAILEGEGGESKKPFLLQSKQEPAFRRQFASLLRTQMGEQVK